MSGAADLSDRIAAIEDREAIRDLMQRYARAADAKYTAYLELRGPETVSQSAAEQAACFAEDAAWSAGQFGGVLSGRAAIAEFFENSPWSYALHHYVCPEIKVDGSTADVRWRLLEIGCPQLDKRVVLLTGVVAQTCRRTTEGWRITSMSFEVLQEIELADSRDAVTCLIPKKGQSA